MISFTSEQLGIWLGTFFWPFARLLALISIAPVLSHATIPARVKISLAILVTLVIAPALPPPPASALVSWNAIILLAQQIGIGLAMGFTLRLIFAAVEMAGDLVGLQMGISFATFIDPQNSTQTPLIGSFLGIVASLVFLSIDGHLILLAAVSESFRVFPVGGDTASLASLKNIVRLGSVVFSIALHIALPALTAMLVCNVALGVLMRAAPQLNLLSIGFPITLLAGLWTLAAGMPWMTHAMQSYLERWPARLPLQ